MRWFLIFFCASSVSQAFEPSVGQYAITRRASQIFDYQKAQTLEKDNGDTFSVRTLLNNPDGDQLLNEAEEVPAIILRKKFFDDVDHFCKQHMGEIEEVTVPAGTFRACKTMYVDEYYELTQWWAAGIPFGLVRSNGVFAQDPADMTTEELLEYEK